MSLIAASALAIAAILLATIAVVQRVRLARLLARNRSRVAGLVNDVRLGRPANFHEVEALLGREGSSSLNDLALLCAAGKERDNHLRALGTSADAVLDRNQLLGRQLANHQTAIAATQQAADSANTGIGSLNAGALQLANSVADSSAAIEQTFASIKIVSDNMTSLADTVDNVSAAIGDLPSRSTTLPETRRKPIFSRSQPTKKRATAANPSNASLSRPAK